MGFYLNQTSESGRKELSYVLQEAADDIVEFGWRVGGTQDSDLDNPNHPRCVWIAAVRALHRHDQHAGAIQYNALEEVILDTAEVADIGDLFDKNDDMALEEGQAWAYGVLTTASHTLNPALANGETVTDTHSTPETDTGSTPSVGTRVLRFLKRFTWVR